MCFDRSLHWEVNTNFLLTERKGRTGEYLPVRSRESEVSK